MLSKEKPMIIIAPHKNKSRKATNEDAEYIAEQSSEMMLLAAKIEHNRDFFDQVYGVHHSQVDKDPIDFFAINPTNDKMTDLWEEYVGAFVIVNPVIINHTRHAVSSVESCLSYAGLAAVQVERWNKITVTYQTISKENDKWELSDPIEKNLGGLISRIFQHEVGHGQAKYIYDL
jgi:peptide deformylase